MFAYYWVQNYIFLKYLSLIVWGPVQYIWERMGTATVSQHGVEGWRGWGWLSVPTDLSGVLSQLISLSHESEPAFVIMCYSRAKDHFLLSFKLQNFYWSFDKFLYSTGPIYGKELNIICLKSKCWNLLAPY